MQFLRVIEQFVRVFLSRDTSVTSFPNFAAIASLEYCTKWCMSEKEPLEDVVRRFKRGGLESAMATLPRVVKLGAPQVS